MNAEERKSALSDSQRTSFGSNHSSPYPASEVDDLQPQPTSVVASVGSKPPESTEISGRKRQTSPYFRKATPKRRPVAHHRRPKKLPLEAINALSTWLSLQEPQNAPSTNDLQYLSRVTGLKPKRVARCLEDICSQYRSPLESYLMSSSEDGGASVGDIERELERRQIGVNHSSTLETTTLQSTTEAFKAMKDGFIFPSYLADERTTTTFKPYWSTLENQLLSNDLMVFPRSQLNFDLASGGPAGIDYLTPPLLAHGCGIPDEPRAGQKPFNRPYQPRPAPSPWSRSQMAPRLCGYPLTKTSLQPPHKTNKSLSGRKGPADTRSSVPSAACP